MANKKRFEFKPLIYNKDLKKLPLVFRFLEVKKTDEIGELYKHVKFSSSNQLQTKSLNNYPDSVPMSNIFLDDTNFNERIK